MGHHPAIALILLCVLIQGSVNAPAQGEEQLDAKIFQLIRNLGSESFREREQAQQRLLNIGSSAIPELQRASMTSDPEVRWRVRQLLSVLIPQVFYTISQDGRLFRLSVSPKSFHCQQLVKLGSPFDQPHVSVEGLAMSSQGTLYASVVFRVNNREHSELYQIAPRTGRATRVGKILSTEIHGLDFAADGRLYGIIASCRQSAATSQTQLIQIDLQTGRATDTPTQVAHGQLQSLAIGRRGQVVVSNGGCGLYGVNLQSRSTTTNLLTGERFCDVMGGHAHLLGLCYGQKNVLFGIRQQKQYSLVHLDLKTGELRQVGLLNFATSNLAVARGEDSTSSPAIAEKPRTKVRP